MASRTNAFLTLAAALLLAALAPAAHADEADAWKSLFNGRDLTGWKASENPGVFTVSDGVLKVHGKRSHLFYEGDVNGGTFKNFHLKLDVKTEPGANSGVYFHTEYQQSGWPKKGFEVQVNNTHSDKKKTAGLYDVKDNFDAPVKDGEWFTLEIIVKDKHIETKVDGKTIVEWTQPDDWSRPGRAIDQGTFCIQGHDPKSVVYYKNITVKVLD